MKVLDHKKSNQTHLNALIFWLLASCGFFSFSQEENEYIQKFPEKVTARIGIQNTSNSFTVFDNETDEFTEFVPNDKTYLGLSLLFRSVEIDIGYAPRFFGENQDNKGSKLFTLNLRTFLRQWMQTFDFYKQKGFFAISDNIKTAFPEIRTTKIGGSTSYIFNKKFSFRAIGFQNEWQKKSAGSFIPSFTFYYTKFNIGGGEDESNDHTYNLAVGPGYYYNWVIKKHFIISAGATIGFGMNILRSEGETTTSALSQAVFRTAIGYNSERFFTGFNFNVQALSHKSDQETSIDDTITFGEFYIGYRLNAPKKWMEKADKVNRKMGWD